MKAKKLESGLIVPVEQPKPKRKLTNTLELGDHENREDAIEALSLLWDALDLTKGGGLIIPDKYESRMLMWEYVAKSLVGKDAPYKEVLC